MPRRELTAPLILRDIARTIGGTITGDETTPITALCPLDAPVAGGLAFSRAGSTAQLQQLLKGSPVAAIIISDKVPADGIPGGIARVVVPDPVYAVTQLVPLFFSPPELPSGISPRAEIDPTATIGKNVRIGPFCVVGPRASIGDDAVLHPHVVVYAGARIGPRSVIHSGATVREECSVGADSVIQNGAVIGADGFGYIPRPGIGLLAVPQVGSVALSDRVDIGANACIDRATLGETRVGIGTKIDNLVQVGHNTVIGQHSIVCGQAGIAGSCSIGNQVVIGGSVGVADHLSISDGVRVAGKAGVIGDLTEKGDYSGFPAVPVRRWNRAMAALLRLADRGSKKG